MLSMRWVGMDVHARETSVAVVDQVSGEVLTGKITGRSAEVLAWLEEIEPPWRAVSEAGPTGYTLARQARARDREVAVCAPGLVPRRATDRIKTDARDALRLARLPAAGELALVRVPEPAEEQRRDLVRAREDVRVDLMRARHRLSQFLLRRALAFPGPGRAWTAAHRDRLCARRFADQASEITFQDMLQAHDGLLTRRARLEEALADLAPASPWAATIARLRCLRGIDTLSAVGLCAEVGDFGRFGHPQLLASSLGLVPSEDSSGSRRRLGSITTAGSQHARRLLVEAAWHERRPPRVSRALGRRQEGQGPRAVDLAWRAQRRLYQRWRRLEGERGTRSTLTAVAVARELSAFCWELARVA
jgi:transposase